MADNTVARFRNFLKRTAVKWSREMPQVGVRLVKIDGEFLREMYRQRKVTRFWKFLLTKLPSDAVLMNSGGDVVLQGVSPAGYMDCHYLIFGSAEWDAIEDGGAIPALEIHFERADIDTSST